MSIKNKDMNLISIDNNIDKLIAFNPSLDRNWRDSQRIFTPKVEFETIDLVENLQTEGWEIQGAIQGKDRMGRVNKNLIKFIHPDIRFGGSVTEGYANAYLDSNFGDFGYNVKTALGALRIVCENGLIAMENIFSETLKLPKTDQTMLNSYLQELGIESGKLMDGFDNMKHEEMSVQDQLRFAEYGLGLRFGSNNNMDSKQLLNIIRPEDEGNDVWRVFNRIQENLTQPARLVNSNGKLIGGIQDPFINKSINQNLSKEAFRFLN